MEQHIGREKTLRLLIVTMFLFVGLGFRQPKWKEHPNVPTVGTHGSLQHAWWVWKMEE